MIIAAIETQMDGLRPSERLVAQYVLGRPNVVVHMSIADLAESAVVSEPTIMRFCKALGCTGFMEFKLALARDLERRTFQRNRDNPAVKGPSGFGQAIFSRTLTGLGEASKALALDKIDEILELCAASRIVTVLHDGSEQRFASELVDSLLSCRIEAAQQSDIVTKIRLDGRLVIALRSCRNLEGFVAFCHDVKDNDGKTVLLGKPDAPHDICLDHINLDVIDSSRSVFLGELIYLAVIETLRAGIVSRLSRTGVFSETASDLLQSQREIAYGDARRRDRQSAQASYDLLNQSKMQAHTRAQDRETA
jgi:RpiR family transcriptional regulator, carbohydrate utilization regulator